jgi:AhpD family alkylhydroperoxidase
MKKLKQMEKDAYIKPPERIPFLLKIGIGISNRVTKKDLLAPKLLAWYPKVAISSGVLESVVAHGKKDLNKRILKLIRVQASVCVACPFCIDMNTFEYEKDGITAEEIGMLAAETPLSEIDTFSAKEKLAVEYTRLISKTPTLIPASFVEELKHEFTEREIVILASTAAQVNYWARMLVALGVPPAGFSDSCSIDPISEETKI